MKKIDLKNLGPVALLPLICLLNQVAWSSGSSPLVYHSNIAPLEQLTALLGSSLLHTNMNHLVMNLAAYGLIYFYSTQSLQGWRMPVITLLCGVGATWGFAISPSPLSSLVGLSGALHGCIVYLAICEFKQAPRLMGLTLAALVGKLLWEQIIGPSTHTAELINASVATWSHVSGAISGVILGVIKLALGEHNKKAPS